MNRKINVKNYGAFKQAEVEFHCCQYICTCNVVVLSGFHFHAWGEVTEKTVCTTATLC